jgi:hypothetical protein
LNTKAGTQETSCLADFKLARCKRSIRHSHVRPLLLSPKSLSSIPAFLIPNIFVYCVVETIRRSDFYVLAKPISMGEVKRAVLSTLSRQCGSAA